MQNLGATAAAELKSESGLRLLVEDPIEQSDTSATLRTVSVLIPLIYNRGRLGIRLPVGLGKIWRTISEMRRDFSGFTLSLCVGWCKADETWDLHLRVEIDTEITSDSEIKLLTWKEILRVRFCQREMYMKASHPIRWL